MNCDGAVTPTDVPLFIDAVLRNQQPSDCAEYVANANGDALPDGSPRIDGIVIQEFVTILSHASQRRRTKKAPPTWRGRFTNAGDQGLEPRLTDPESVVLPLH